MTDGVSRRRIDFARWRSDVPSGGNRYDEELTAALRHLGHDLKEHAVTGSWPIPEQHDLQRLADMLDTGQNWLIGNIVASAALEEITSAVERGRRVTVLLHYFPRDDVSLSIRERQRLEATEAAAVRVATSVVVTSFWAAAEVSARFGRDDAVVAQPGVRPADVAPGSRSGGQKPRLLWLGRVTAAKDPLTFIEALIQLQDLDWTARLVGPKSTDPGLNQMLQDRIGEASLDDRVELTGPQTGDSLEQTWAATDLLVHTSRSETYGMVVSEALARGIPSVVAKGTGAVEAQMVGATFAQSSAVGLARELRIWLTDPELGRRWRADAASKRAQLQTWEDTAMIVAATVTT